MFHIKYDISDVLYTKRCTVLFHHALFVKLRARNALHFTDSFRMD